MKARKLLARVSKTTLNECQKFVKEHADYFVYHTDDCKEFDTLNEALSYVNSKKGEEATKIIRKQINSDFLMESLVNKGENNGYEIPDTVVWTRKAGMTLKESSLNKKGDTHRKNRKRAFERTSNTNPKRNMEIFNHMMGSDTTSSSETSVSESVKEDYTDNKAWVLEKVTGDGKLSRWY